MTRCCRCNGYGRCRGCIRAKNNRVCNNCMPGKDNRCENQTTVLPRLTQDGYPTVQRKSIKPKSTSRSSKYNRFYCYTACNV